mgnify:CR=1 FL=1
MNLLDIFKKNDVSNSTGILSEPGDKLEARVTDSNRKVGKESSAASDVYKRQQWEI